MDGKVGRMAEESIRQAELLTSRPAIKMLALQWMEEEIGETESARDRWNDRVILHRRTRKGRIHTSRCPPPIETPWTFADWYEQDILKAITKTALFTGSFAGSQRSSPQPAKSF